MNKLPKVLAAAALATLVWAGPTSAADAPTTAIQQIQQAADPSAVVDAYARAAAANPDNVAVQRAYVQRMVDLGAPDLAYSQAMTLTTSDPGNGLAWAVVADTKGLRGDADAAIDNIAKAQKLAPGDAFVLRISGQLLAWYDVHLDKSKLTQGTKDSAEALRHAVGGQQAFVDAYGQTKAAYTAQAAAPVPTPAPAPVQTPAPAPSADSAPLPPVYYDAPAYSYSAPQAPTYYYAQPPVVVAPDYGPYYYYGSPYYYPSYWWGGGLFIGVGGRRHFDGGHHDFHGGSHGHH